MSANSLRCFEGAVVLITSGASGIGRSLGEELARRGAHPVLADRQGDLAREIADAIRSQGGEAAAAEPRRPRPSLDGRGVVHGVAGGLEEQNGQTEA